MNTSIGVSVSSTASTKVTDKSEQLSVMPSTQVWAISDNSGALETEISPGTHVT
jgi:hypothetical protein